MASDPKAKGAKPEDLADLRFIKVLDDAAISSTCIRDVVGLDRNDSLVFTKSSQSSETGASSGS